ncbi:TIGR03943 family protein [Tissierella sp. MSJ-40]|uniref:TIGR03943 family protein n=1 Tax=Tissierella simiarum TaxID=2841534 RepID=A0ABS6E751_9FIRM|nr:TIGR03943 family protein [Tissierella simiarum]
MRSKKRYGINIEVIFRLIFLLGFTTFFYVVIKNRTVQYYVHPRIIPYMKFGIFSFILMSLFFIEELFKTRRKNTRLVNYIFFFIPLFTSFISPPKSINPASISLNNINKNNISSNSFVKDSNIGSEENDDIISDLPSDKSVFYNNIANDKKDQLVLQGNVIVIDDDNFIPWLDELYMNMIEYEGEEIEMIGFVLKDSEFKQNEFVIARLMMVCCAADTQAVGFLCNYDKASELKGDSWIKVKGFLKTIELNKEKIPIIEIKDIENIDKPENEFIYPY